MSEDVAGLLAEWRGAQRRFEALEDADTTCPTAASEVARAWLAYQLATGGLDEDEAILIVDDDRRYVAASPNVERVLGITVDRLLTMRIDDITLPARLGGLDESWRAFLAGAPIDGEYDWSAGAESVPVRYRARPNWPVRHVHVSQLKPEPTARGAGSRRADDSWQAVAQSYSSIDSSRELIRAMRGPQPQSIASADTPWVEKAGPELADPDDVSEAS